VKKEVSGGVGDGGYTCTVHGICVKGVHLRTEALAEVTYIRNGIMVFEVRDGGI